MNVKERVEQLTDEMKAALARLVKYNSVEADPLPGKPFGEQPAAVLAEALQIASNLGFKTKNLDNYCGYAEIGEGKEIIGIVAHLDIVPAGDGWATNPFEMVEKDGCLYGRGVSDDKGAAVASMYAMKIIKELGIPLKKRIRLILGCNEETGSKCMDHYNEVEEPVSLGFTPDGEFPGIFGEKGMLKMTARSKNTSIISMNGGVVSNAVCDKCETIIPITAVIIERLKDELSKTPLVDSKVDVVDGNIRIFAQGEAAHASTPLLGINAASCTMQALENAGMNDDFVSYYNSHIGITCDGEGYGLNVSDDYGPLTLCNGLVSSKDGQIKCSVDIRFPVTYSVKKITELVTPNLEDREGITEINFAAEPLFYKANSPLVRSLYNSYVAVTGDKVTQPMVIGGGTYAKHIKGIIAFGCGFPGTENRIHNTDEFLVISEFKTQTEIYVQAIKNLLAL